MSGDLHTALSAALAAEEAAIYGYGVAGAHLSGDAQQACRNAELVHRTRRDAALMQRGTVVSPSFRPGGLPGETGAPPTATGGPNYALPFPVADAQSALKLAIVIEERTAAAWLAAIPASADNLRRLAADAVADAAVRATRWRLRADVRPTTVPFPGT